LHALKAQIARLVSVNTLTGTVLVFHVQMMLMAVIRHVHALNQAIVQNYVPLLILAFMEAFVLLTVIV
jgi:hypothetical protein